MHENDIGQMLKLSNSFELTYLGEALFTDLFPFILSAYSYEKVPYKIPASLPVILQACVKYPRLRRLNRDLI